MTEQGIPTPNFDPADIENFNQVRGRFAEALTEHGFPQKLTSSLIGQVYGNMVYEYDDAKLACDFVDIGFRQDKSRGGPYKITMGGKTMRARGRRLLGIVPDSQIERVTFIWLAAHELGHATQVAYSLASAHVRQEGDLKGQTNYPLPQEKIYSEHIEDGIPVSKVGGLMSIQSEREAEGFGRMMLVKELKSLGVEDIEAKLEQIYTPLKKQAEDIIAGNIRPNDPDETHAIGYANPMEVEELVEVFSN